MSEIKDKWDWFCSTVKIDIPKARTREEKQQLARTAFDLSEQLVKASYNTKSKAIYDEWKELLSVAGQYLDGEDKAIEGKPHFQQKYFKDTKYLHFICIFCT